MRPTTSLALIGLSAALLVTPSFAQQSGDIDKLEELVQQTRAELAALRAQLGLRDEHGESVPEARGEHGEVRREARGEHGEVRREGQGEHGEGGREARGEHGEVRREGRGEHGEVRREGRGEHGEAGREGSGEESGKRLDKRQTWDATRSGARLILAYDPGTRSFRGTVQNVSAKTLSAVRVEVHLSNGVELGPTKRTDLQPGKQIPVELSAADQEFEWWTTHPEHGSEEGHGAEHGGEEGKGEHGSSEGAGNRPGDPALRPLYNELLLLRREIQMLAEDLATRSGRDRRR